MSEHTCSCTEEIAQLRRELEAERQNKVVSLLEALRIVREWKSDGQAS